MAAFVVSTAGINDQRGVNMAFDGLTFTASAAATVQMNASQFSLTEFFGAPLVFTGNNRTNTVEIFVNTASFNASAISLVSWGTADRLLIRDAVGNQNMTGSVQNDTFFVTAGLDTVTGGGGDDIVSVDWSAVAGNFTSNGAGQFTNFSNTSLTFSGALTFNILLGAGNDTLTLGAGNDTIAGGGGNDGLNTGLGNATVDGGSGTDLWAADFSNNATGATVDVNLAGVNDAGNGSSYQGLERLNLIGGAGDDSFASTTGNSNDGLADTLNGGAGNDRLTVGGGLDIVDGGTDTDTLVINWAGDLSAFSSNGPGQITDFSNTSVTYSNIENFDITLGEGNDNVTIGTGNDTMRGMGGSDTLNSGAGNATVDGGAGTDLWIADFSGNATAAVVDVNLVGVNDAGNGSQYQALERLGLTGGAGNDTFVSTTGNSNNGFNDTLNSGAGNDRLTVGGGLDNVDGGADNDLLIVNWAGDASGFSSNGVTQITDFSNTSVTFVNIERFNLTLGEGNDNVFVSTGFDTIRGMGGNDTLNAGQGEVVMDGGAGTDTWISDLTLSNKARTIDLNLTGGPKSAGNGTTYRNVEAMNMTTGSGADRLITQTGLFRDTLNGGAGNDTLGVGGGLDIANGGDGTNDLLIVDYAAKTGNFSTNGPAQFTDFSTTNVSFSGIERFDVRLGSGNDNILLLGGNDSLSGGAGNDVLNTAAGEAVVDGGTGTDTWLADLTGQNVARVIDLTLAGVQVAGGGTTYAGVEAMNITTGGGDDRLITLDLTLNDNLSGGAGNDTFLVAGGLDTVAGGEGTDDLLIVDYSGKTGNFVMNGVGQFTNFSGHSVSFSGIEHFDLRLGGGNDSVVLLGGNDSLSGGAGNDVLNTATGEAAVDGGEGNDTWNADLSGQDVAREIDLTLAGVQVAGGGTTYAGIEAMSMTTGGGDDRLITLTLTMNDNLTSGAGNDTLKVGGGVDIVAGGDGTDDLLIVDYTDKTGNFVMNGVAQFTNFAGQSVSFTGIEHFDVTLGGGNDNILLLAGNDSLSGGAGNDVLNTAAGEAEVDGGDGTDTWLADLSGQDVDRVIDLTLAGAQVAGGSTTYAGVEAMSVTTGGGDDRLITLSAILNDALTAGDGNDTIQVGGGLDVANGGLGADDLLIVDYSAVTGNFGMNGAAQITNFAGSSISFSGIEHFDIRMGNGNDNILLGDFADTMRGGLGNDTMNGGAGVDTMDWRDATGDVTATVTGLTGAGTASGVGIGSDTFTDFENYLLGIGNDRFTGNGEGNLVDGGAGNDTIRGGGGRNELLGGDGRDRITGGTGRDFITGGLGDDELQGGAGQNSFIYNDITDSGTTAATRDRITGFVTGVDEIDLTAIDAITGGADDAFVFLGEVAAFTGVGQIRLEQVGADTMVRLNLDPDANSEATILLVGITAATLVAGDFDL